MFLFPDWVGGHRAVCNWFEVFINHITPIFNSITTDIHVYEHANCVKKRNIYLLRSYFFTRPAVNIAVKKSIYNELDHVISSQLSGHCDTISSRLWRHQQNENRMSETKDSYVKIIVFIVIYGFVMWCKKWNNLCSLVANCFCAPLSVS